MDPSLASQSRSFQPAAPRGQTDGGGLRVVGIDPGLSETGYGVLLDAPGRPQVVEIGLLKTDAREDLPCRLLRLHREVEQLMGEVRPGLVALEDVFSHQRFPRSAIVLGHARGVICSAAAAAGIPVITIAPSAVPVHHEFSGTTIAPSAVKRVVTGSGRATKAQVQSSVCTLLGLSRISGSHAADALALAYAALSRLGVLRR